MAVHSASWRLAADSQLAISARALMASRKSIAALALLALIAFTTYWCAFRVTTGGSGSRLHFADSTGLAWPPNGSLVRSVDSHGGFLGDGEFYVVFDADEATIQKWLEGPAPWGGNWRHGPIPGEAGIHCSFGTSGVSWGGVVGKPSSYSGDKELVDLLSSTSVIFAARERCCASLPWHNGNLLIIDPGSRRVWLSVWDF